MCSSFDVNAINEVEQHEERTELAVPPTEEEVMEAIGKLKGGKAGGRNGILPEMVKSCGGQLMDYMLDLFQTVWSEQQVPEEWRRLACAHPQERRSHTV